MKKLFRTSVKPQASERRAGSLQDFPVPQAVGNNAHLGLQPKFTVPPVPHPTPHYRIAILASTLGLLLRPETPDNLDTIVKVSWGENVVVEELGNDTEVPDSDWKEAAVVYGILGMLQLNAGAYVLVITAKTDIGAYLDPRNDVYAIKSVAAIPLLYTQALSIVNGIAIRYNQENTLLGNSGTALSDIPSSSELLDFAQQARPDATQNTQNTKVTFAATHDVKVMTPRAEQEFRPVSPTSSISSGTSTPLSDSDGVTPLAKTISSRLSFWSRMSKRQPSYSAEEETLRESIQDKLDDLEDSEEPSNVLQEIIQVSSPDPKTLEEKHNALDEKILKVCIREYTKGSMYFAYNFDLTTSLQHKQHEVGRLRRRATSQTRRTASMTSPYQDDEPVDILAEAHPTLPLWRRVTKQFWWNEWMLQPLIDAGLHSYVVPVMQGFLQISTFSVPRIPEETETGDKAIVEYFLFSRRSRDRAGLRYQRRGVDDDANVANFVETESVVRVEREGISNVFSYIQLRGSIPLFWTQSGYSLKPPPLLSPDRTHQQNLDAVRRHFAKVIPRYGPQTIVNLAEKTGKEAGLTNAYREYINELSSKDIRFCEYDFHAETKGMRYENISKLIEKLSRTFDSQGYTWISGGTLMSEQKAAFRVNCIDCLDRTNVVQSAFGRYVLTKQLGALALLNPLEPNSSDLDIVFNDMWANNGDAISKAYAGTSALKGDYTRTGKRDLGGMLNDGMNSLARMYSSTFSDWFSQAVIDFMLGYRTLSVFSEFLMKLESTDPRERIRIYKIRAEAIATSVSRVLSEGERLLSGWTLLSPSELNTRLSEDFEEKVLLLSVQALYIVSYDYTLDKVSKYTRIPLGQIVYITKGEYILSPLEEGSRNPLQNYGLKVSYLTAKETTRVTSYSLRNCADDLSEVPQSPTANRIPTRRGSNVLSRVLSEAASEKAEAIAFAAFKALPIDPARARRTTGSFEETADDLSWAKNCKEAVDMIVSTIQQAVEDVGGLHDGFVKEEAIVNLAEAQRMTTVMSKMEYGLKRLLWLGS